MTTPRTPTDEIDAIIAYLNRNPAAREQLRSAMGNEQTWVARPDNAQEIGGPTLALLQDLNLLEDNAQHFRWWEGTPFSKQAITAGATGLAKIAAPAVGVPGLIAAVTTYFQSWGSSTAKDWVLLGCATLILIATAFAVAIIVHADLSARASATAAQYQARAATAAAYLGACRAASTPAVPSEPLTLIEFDGHVLR